MQDSRDLANPFSSFYTTFKTNLYSHFSTFKIKLQKYVENVSAILRRTWGRSERTACFHSVFISVGYKWP